MKPFLFATASILALTIGVSALRRSRGGQRLLSQASQDPDRLLEAAGSRMRAALPERALRPLDEMRRLVVAAADAPGHATDTAEITRNFLLYFIIPLWLTAGVADWLCHRATHIESTTGVKETLIHILMLVEVGVPVLAGLFLEITSPVLALMIAAFFVHDATALWDVSYAVTGRNVTPIEQHVHSFLEMIPLMAVSFVAILHWPQLLALFGLGREKPDLSLRWKRDSLPTRYVVGVLAAIAIFEGLPYLEELWRDLRTYPARLVPPSRRLSGGGLA